MTIFKSCQVNLDPEPWAYSRNAKSGPGPFGHSDRAATRVDAAMLWFPRPEFEPTRDPAPWLIKPGQGEPGLRKIFDPESGHDRWDWSPRREQFDTPVNPVLVAFRETFDGDMRGWGVWLALAGDELRQDGICTPEHIDHARRVLTRLAEYK